MSILKVPKQIMVGGHQYQIICHESDALKDDGIWGQINHRTQTIQIRDDRPSSQLFTSLLHELIHAASFVYNKDKLEESQIDPIAQGLMQILAQMGVELDWSEVREEK